MKRWPNWRPQWAYLAGLYLDFLDREGSGQLGILRGLDREDSRRGWDHGIPSAVYWPGIECEVNPNDRGGLSDE